MTEYRFMLGSNICIYLLNDASPALARRVGEQDEGTLCCSAVTLAEIAVGYGKDAVEALQLTAFLAEIPSVPFEEQAARIYGGLPFRRTRFDRLIAAHALALGLTLVTNNEADFADVPGLAVENWTL